MGLPGARLAPPSTMLRLLESRAVFELGAVAATAPWLRLIGRGDAHPVLVLPGFLTGDPATTPLRSILRGQGYWVHGWNLGRNLGPTPEVVEGLITRLHDLHDQHGSPVSLVGWSLGGIYARRLARVYPELVRQVITLGSPFRITAEQRSAVSGLFDRLQDRHVVSVGEALQVPDTAPLEVPSTAIYTRTDGVVRWWQCIETIGPRRENIEVHGSHSGLGFNPAVVIAVSDRLAQRPGQWRPFRAPVGLGHLYPHPADYRDSADRVA